MPWLFIIPGSIVFISALYGLITAAQARRRFALEAAELGLLALALVMHHTSTAGWIALFAALVVEAVRQISIRPKAPLPTVSESPIPSPIEIESSSTSTLSAIQEARPDAPIPSAKPLPAPMAPASPRPAAPPLVSVALLRATWQPAPEVFLASLRRGGERGATLTSGAQGQPIRLDVDGRSLELDCVARPLPRQQIDDAAAQSWEWPNAAKTAGAQVGHVVFTTRAAGDSRAASIRLHCRAQLALAEFAPVIAVLWPAAGRLIPLAAISQLDSLAGDFDLAKATCINFRTYPLEGAEAGRFLCDTVGFSALGVADLEIERDVEPDATITAAIYQRAEQMFAAECDINTDGAMFEHRGTTWQIERARSRFAPDRVVARWVRLGERGP